MAKLRRSDQDNSTKLNDRISKFNVDNIVNKWSNIHLQICVKNDLYLLCSGKPSFLLGIITAVHVIVDYIELIRIDYLTKLCKM